MATDFKDGQTPVVADWLDKVFGSNGHVHDGQDKDGHAPKVDMQDHTYFGDYGKLTRVFDNFNAGAGFAEFKAKLESTDPNSDSYFWLVADYLSAALGTIELGDHGTLQSVTDTSNLFALLVSNRSGGDGKLKADILEALSKVASSVLQPNSGNIIDVQDDGDNSGKGGFLLSLLKQQPSGGIEVLDSADNPNGRLYGLSAPRAIVQINGFGAPNADGYGIDSVRRGGSAKGHYEVELSEKMANSTRYVAVASPKTAVRDITHQGLDFSGDGNQNDGIDIRTHDGSGSLSDTDFSLVVYYRV